MRLGTAPKRSYQGDFIGYGAGRFPVSRCSLNTNDADQLRDIPLVLNPPGRSPER